MNNEEIEGTLDNLIELHNTDYKLYCKTYKTLPFSLYCEIERLSVSKSTLYKELCEKASFVAENFHRKIK